MSTLFGVDAFSARPFSGNPAAVCLLDRAPSSDWAQSVAAEMNLSETAFVYPTSAGLGIRWFTPLAEVDLCGHATLASAHVLWQTGRVRPEDLIRLESRSGVLTARRVDPWIELDFPAQPATRFPEPPGLAELLDVPIRAFGRSRTDALVVTDSEEIVRAANPDLVRLRNLDARGIIVTAPSATEETHFVSRFFAPAVGVPEDPVTGSAHCTLAPYWAQRLGQTEMIGRQVSKRGGIVRVRLENDRVKLGGQAVTVWHGSLSGVPG